MALLVLCSGCTTHLLWVKHRGLQKEKRPRKLQASIYDGAEQALYLSINYSGSGDEPRCIRLQPVAASGTVQARASFCQDQLWRLSSPLYGADPRGPSEVKLGGDRRVLFRYGKRWHSVELPYDGVKEPPPPGATAWRVALTPLTAAVDLVTLPLQGIVLLAFQF